MHWLREAGSGRRFENSCEYHGSVAAENKYYTGLFRGLCRRKGILASRGTYCTCPLVPIHCYTSFIYFLPLDDLCREEELTWRHLEQYRHLFIYRTIPEISCPFSLLSSPFILLPSPFPLFLLLSAFSLPLSPFSFLPSPFPLLSPISLLMTPPIFRYGWNTQ